MKNSLTSLTWVLIATMVSLALLLLSTLTLTGLRYEKNQRLAKINEVGTTTVAVKVSSFTPDSEGFATQPTTVAPAEETQTEKVVKVPYPVRKPGDSQYRDALEITAAEAFVLLNDPDFFEPEAIQGVQPRIVKLKKSLKQQFASGEIVRRLTPEQIIAICLRETCNDDDRLAINLNCLGDRKYAGYNKAHGPVQISKRAYEDVKAFKGYGVIGPDFHGDLALSEMFFQAWVDQYLPKKFTGDEVFEWASRYWNGGPTGAKPGGIYFSKARRYWEGDNRLGVEQYYAKVQTLIAETASTSPLGDLVFRQTWVISGDVSGDKGLLPTFFKHPIYGTEVGGEIDARLFPEGSVKWAQAQFILP